MSEPVCLKYLVPYFKEVYQRDYPSDCKDCEKKILCELQTQ